MPVYLVRLLVLGMDYDEDDVITDYYFEDTTYF